MSVELPRDAEGREIPLDTECLYTHGGEKQDVLSFTYYRKKDRWEIQTDTRFINATYLYLTPPDSWKKLEEDIRRIGTDDCTWFCGYANENPVENACPDSCKFFKGDEITCRKKLADDILSRIRKLRGEA